MSDASTFTRTAIRKNWSFSQVSSEQSPDVEESWEACKVPTSVHVELKRLGKIPDPFKDLNEWEVQCKCSVLGSASACLLTRLQGCKRLTGCSKRPLMWTNRS